MPLPHLYRRASGVAAAMMLLSRASSPSAAGPDAVPTRPLLTCEAQTAFVPPTIQVDDVLGPRVAAMLRLSPTFRRQCRRLAGAQLLYVRLRIDGTLVDRPYRARTVVQRFKSGVMIATIAVRPLGLPDEWIAHEFEHVLEQVEGIRLADLADRTRGVWRTAVDMYETLRAIRAGRAVVAEMRRPMARGDILVE